MRSMTDLRVRYGASVGFQAALQDVRCGDRIGMSCVSHQTTGSRALVVMWRAAEVVDVQLLWSTPLEARHDEKVLRKIGRIPNAHLGKWLPSSPVFASDAAVFLQLRITIG